MIDISGRAVRAGIRSITAVATASSFAVIPQVTAFAAAHTADKAGRAHHRVTPHRDHNGREGRDHARGHADVVVDTKGPRGTIVPGKTYKWPFEVTNRGTAPAKHVALTAAPDRSLKVLSAPPKCHQRKAGPLVCDIGLLPRGKSRHGVITARVVPRARSGKSLSNPVQVSWQNAPAPGRRMAAFPPVEVSPDGSPTGAFPEGPAYGDARDNLPYPLMVTEHGPGTAESVVVRSPIGAPAVEGPCSSGVLPAKEAGKSAPIKPAFGSCAAQQDDPAACGCGAAAHERPASDLPTENAVIPERPAEADHPAAAPCGAVAARPVIIPDRPVTPPCAGVQDRPEAVAEDPAPAPAPAPCGAVAVRPVFPEHPAAVPPCAHGRPESVQDRPDADQAHAGRPAIDRTDADKPIATACGAADRPVILPARPVIVPERPAAAPPCAAGKPAAAPSSEIADQPVIDRGDKIPPAKEDKADKPAVDRPAAADRPSVDRPSVDRPSVDKAEAPVATPCGAAAARPVDVPGQPVVVGEMPAIPPCAQSRPHACGCLHGDSVPAAPAAEPVSPVIPAVPAVPGVSEAAPCAAADKPMSGKAASELPAGPACGAAQDAPAAVHEEPGITPDGATPMSPLTGPGKAAHHPLGRPHHHEPLGSGRAHRDCVRQGAGFVCPLGAAPHHRPHVINLGSPGHPHALHCVGAAGAACHTRAARPVPVVERPGRELPTTGSPSGLLALAGLGLAGAGAVLYRLTRTRREDG